MPDIRYSGNELTYWNAIEVGQNRYGGDDRRVGLWVHADSLAVHVIGGMEAQYECNDRWVDTHIYSSHNRITALHNSSLKSAYKFGGKMPINKIVGVLYLIIAILFFLAVVGPRY